MPGIRPHLAAAVVCEKVLQEKDEVLTVVRLIDTLWVSVPKNLPADANPAIQVTVLLSFRKATSGTQPEKHQVSVRLNPPSEPPVEPKKETMDLLFPEGEPSSANVILNVSVPIREFGLFCLDVFVDDELATRVPFRLQERPAESPRMIH